MIKFPGMVDWIEDEGLSYLHKQHIDFVKDTGVKLTFSEFVENQYKVAKDNWQEKMYYNNRKLKVPFGEEKDIDVALAIEVMTTIINEAIDKDEVARLILTDDMAPDHDTATIITGAFFYKVLPAIEKTLNGLGE